MTQDSETTDRRTAPLERRGLIAAGAALVTGALAKVMAKPAAAGHPLSDPTVLHLNVQNTSNASTKIEGKIDGLVLEVTNTKGPAASFRGAANYTLYVQADPPNAAAVYAAALGAGAGPAFYGYSHADAAMLGFTQASTGDRPALHLNSPNGHGAVALSRYVGFRGEANDYSGIGVQGEAKGADGIGLWGVGGKDGVFGGSLAGAGVHGYCPSSAGYAGKFKGNVNVIGTLTKSGGGFKIDHPLDPANKFLSHSFVESPDMKTVYDGVAVLDDTGRAVVDLPEWLEALNREFRYQLTPIGSPAPDLNVAEEIANNRFQIAGGPPGVRVSWQVTGTRRDAYAEHHRVPVEEVKSAGERGKYLHPLEHSQPERLGIFYGDIERAERLQMEVSKSNEELKEREAELLKQLEELQRR